MVQLKERDLTQEEFDQLDKEWQAEKTKGETRLNELKDVYNKKQAEKRERIAQGFVYDDTIWLEMYAPPESDEPIFISPFLYESLPAQDGDFLHSELPDDLTLVYRKNVRLYQDQLKAIDRLWEGLKGTNRRFWRAKAKTWLSEIEHLGPFFDSKTIYIEGTDSIPTEPEFPILCRPSRLTIEQLENEDVEDFSSLPERVGDKPRLDLARLFASLLRGQGSPTSNPQGKMPPNPSQMSARPVPERSPLATLEEFLRALAAKDSNDD
jgi:hypothetical protein